MREAVDTGPRRSATARVGVRAEPVSAGARRLLVLAAVLVFLAGLQLFVFTTRTERWFAWTIGSPLTAAFLGASYWSAVGLELGAALAPTWHRARIAVPAVFVFTTLTLLVTLWHLERFHLGAGHPLITQLVTWGWIAVYALVPVAMVMVVARQRRDATIRSAQREPLPPAMRIALGGLTVVMVGLGAALLLWPGWADGAWAWPLTALTGRAVGAWLVGLGVGAGHAALIDDRPAVRPLAITGVVFVMLQAVSLVRYGDEFTGAGPTTGYLVALGLLGVVSVWALVRRPSTP